VNIIVLATLLALAEGASGLVLFAYRLYVRPWATAEAYHAKNDPELGWVNIPGYFNPNMYGPGRSLRINQQGFRGAEEYTPDPPAGRARLVCSGDSFAFGFGVDDEQAWCRLLETQTGRLQTINMAVSGYGVDQAYLWYKRDGGRFRHSVQVFAFIEDDFRRMRTGGDKPVLRLESGHIVVDNVPVPDRRWQRALRPLTVYRELDVSRLTSLVWKRLSPPPAPPPLDLNLLDAVVHDLKRLNDERGSRLVIVRLPQSADWVDVEHLRFAAAAAREGVPFFDLGDEFNALAWSTRGALFLGGAPGLYPDDWDHYSAAGNRWAAEKILDRLRSTPELATVLGLAP